ncbi:unnamed protein product [Paramecium sonneborni]|uniref:Uncharacterized protein n=1 Tax=Paramecium sonneborni TaxID=65129 RepID=A0A8S1MRE9_9CILI|nr:unnamed protein product [Paramecium sonneborni]
MNTVCQQKTATPCRFETTQSYLLDQSPKIQYRRVNSPGLPDCSFRKSHKSSVDKRNYMTLGQMDIQQLLKPTRSLEESPEQKLKPYYVKGEEMIDHHQHSFNPQQYMSLKEDKEIQVEEKPYGSPPKMEVFQKPQQRKQMKMVDKIESDKVSVEIFMSEQDENSLIFTGITKRIVPSPEENKQILMQNLQQLFTSIDKSTNSNKFQNYIKMESLEQSVFHQHMNKSTQQDFLSISSAQSIKQQKCSSQTNFRRNSAIIPKQQSKWNNSTKANKQKNVCSSNKQSKSPFLKAQNQKVSISKPKLQQINLNIQSPQKIPTQKKQPQTQQNRSTVQKVRSFHITPEKIDDCIYDERFYK